MSDWVKLGLTAAGSVAVVWNMVQQHEYRLDKVESAFEKHLDAHDRDSKEIQRALNAIDLKLTRMDAEPRNAP